MLCVLLSMVIKHLAFRAISRAFNGRTRTTTRTAELEDMRTNIGAEEKLEYNERAYMYDLAKHCREDTDHIGLLE